MTDEARVWIVKRKMKRGPTYHLRWIDPSVGKWRARMVGTDKRVAEREAAKLEQELHQGTYRHITRINWADFAAEHVRNLPGKRNAEEAERILTKFGEAMTPAGPRAVTYPMLEAFVAHLRKNGNALPTINKALRYVRAALGKAVKRGYVDRNIMDAWDWEREEQPLPRALTAEEKTKLIAACPTEQWRAFVIVALTSGCRRGELLALTWNRVDFDNDQIVITGTKGKRDRIQPLCSEATAILRALQAATLKDGGPFASMRHNINKHYRAIVKDAGIIYCTIHDLRRTFCTDLARANVNQIVVQKLAGHASTSTTARYYQAVDEQMKREAINRLQRGVG